jgi:hypothetical protein
LGGYDPLLGTAIQQRGREYHACAECMAGWIHRLEQGILTYSPRLDANKGSVPSAAGGMELPGFIPLKIWTDPTLSYFQPLRNGERSRTHIAHAMAVGDRPMNLILIFLCFFMLSPPYQAEDFRQIHGDQRKLQAASFDDQAVHDSMQPRMGRRSHGEAVERGRRRRRRSVGGGSLDENRVLETPRMGRGETRGQTINPGSVRQGEGGTTDDLSATEISKTESGSRSRSRPASRESRFMSSSSAVLSGDALALSREAWVWRSFDRPPAFSGTCASSAKSGGDGSGDDGALKTGAPPCSGLVGVFSHP